ncbi:CheB methylesterase [Clostridium cellulovorans 743B]|uniref:protein-glutamate methylesterase n=1 Tax=Clostridium cellulovorans (strain ATCC 35296 / DSM 3052 / OCM 3 / 743B) TaxID=573061 RepID=D9SKD9_CLOC7|nr:CheB methylesterase [Clostridium cellulovorans 743B]
MIPRKKIDAVVIGASTGGPKALNTIIPNLPSDLGMPVFVVQHMPVGMTKDFANRLNLNSKIKVVEAKDFEVIEKNTVYIAPGGYHMEVENDNRIHLNSDPAIWGVRPAADKLFISASNVYKGKLLGIVLTGMGRDGAEGIVKIKENGGITLSQDKDSCTIYGMPKAAFETGKVDKVIPLASVVDEIINICSSTGR